MTTDLTLHRPLQAPASPPVADTFDPRTVSWVMEKADLRHLLEQLRAAPAITYDLETTGLDEHAVTHGSSNGGVAARIVLASFTIPTMEDGEEVGEPSTFVVPLSHPESPWLGSWRTVMRHLAKGMRDSGVVLIGHNIKFDHRWTFACTGVDLSHSPLWDTRISSHLLDENASTQLKERAPDTFGVQRWDDVDLHHPGAAEEEPLFKLGVYAARDTYWTWKLCAAHRLRMIPEPYADLYGDEITDARLGDLAVTVAMPTTATLTAMEQRGMNLDLEWVDVRIAEEEQLAERERAYLVSRYVSEDLEGMVVSFAATSKWFKRWTELAVENGDLRVAALTPGGSPQWSKKVLAKQARAGSEVADRLLSHRGAVKRLEYLRSWRDKASAQGTIHANYNAGSVVTGRLSSSEPNMQQVTKALKPAFVPSPGYYLAELDYSQIELRVAAFISRCAPMMNAFKNGEDLHRLIAARINAKDPEEVTKEERQQGKAANFGLLYGMGATGFRDYAEDTYGVHFTEQEAAQVHEAFFEMWTGIREWHGRAVVRAHEQGEIVSPIGRVRRVPDVWDGNDRVAGAAERQAINSPVQGFASDIMQIAAACIEGTMAGIDPVEGARIVGTVHDSILVEVQAERWQEVTEQCKAVMENVVPEVLERMGCEFDVPLVADATVGTRWGLEDVGTL